jgi:TonB family protein
MRRSIKIGLSSGLLYVIALFGFSLHLAGQTSSELETIATRTAERVTKTHQQHIFVAGLLNCQLDMELCTQFEDTLRAKLEKMAPGVQFAQRESVINQLTSRGFIAFDAYIPDVLKSVAPLAGVESLVTDTLQWQPDGYELTSEVYDVVHRKKLDQFRAKIARTVPDSRGEPLVFTDPDTRASVIIFRGKQSRPPAVEYPACDRCPDPSYTPEARAHRVEGRVLMLATITEQGIADHIAVINGLQDGLTDKAVEAVRGWHFKPAIGKDGKPFAARMPIEVTFLLQ